MNKHQAILAINSSVVTISDDNAFDANGNPVTYDESAVQAYIDANAYKEKRQQAYPSIPDQLDLIYHQGIDAWKAAIDAVKQEYPKP
jgi:rhodanese-related sulfurtransferase